MGEWHLSFLDQRGRKIITGQVELINMATLTSDFGLTRWRPCLFTCFSETWTQRWCTGNEVEMPEMS